MWSFCFSTLFYMDNLGQYNKKSIDQKTKKKSGSFWWCPPQSWAQRFCTNLECRQPFKTRAIMEKHFSAANDCHPPADAPQWIKTKKRQALQKKRMSKKTEPAPPRAEPCRRRAEQAAPSQTPALLQGGEGVVAVPQL